MIIISVLIMWHSRFMSRLCILQFYFKLSTVLHFCFHLSFLIGFLSFILFVNDSEDFLWFIWRSLGLLLKKSMTFINKSQYFIFHKLLISKKLSLFKFVKFISLNLILCQQKSWFLSNFLSQLINRFILFCDSSLSILYLFLLLFQPFFAPCQFDIVLSLFLL